jgi:hypothetical protein
MSWKKPGRARYIVIVEQQGGAWEYSRGEGDTDQLWYASANWPNPMRQPGEPINFGGSGSTRSRARLSRSRLRSKARVPLVSESRVRAPG